MARNVSTYVFGGCARGCLAVSAIALAAAIGFGAVAPAHAQTSGAGTVVVTDDLDAPDAPVATAALAKVATPAVSTKKVVNGAFAVEVDNGWVVWQGATNTPSMEFYDTFSDGSFGSTGSIKLKTAGVGSSSTGVGFDTAGVVFAPVPQGQGKATLSEGGIYGVGIGFGELTSGGAGGSLSGWFSDDNIQAHASDPTNFLPGAITAVAVDPTNGAYAVGWDQAATPTGQAFVLKLNSTGKTYAPVGRTNLGTLGGTASQALGISQHATYVVGSATTTAGKQHATYAPIGATSWTDLQAVFPASFNGRKIAKSQALAASDDGYVAGTAVVHEDAAGRKNVAVKIGFVYNVTTPAVPPTFFELVGANVIPLKVLNGTGGKVVGYLDFVNPKGSPGGTIPATHPFLFNGTNLTDFGVMTLPGGAPAYGCRPNRPNHLGEMVGSCIPNSTTGYGVGGTAFYLNATATTPTFFNLNATIHATQDSLVSALKPYSLGTASSIDDQDEVTLVGFKVVGGLPSRAAFLVSKCTYQTCP